MVYKLNELELVLKIARKGINKLLMEKPRGGIISNKGTVEESKMSYEEALLCLERVERCFSYKGAFSFGVCGNCTKWNPSGHCTSRWEDFGTCSESKKMKHRYDSCENHSKTEGGWGL